ncbi:MAG: hypothetical protein AABY22_28360 [Nanoarchaeota archaeon]
MSVNDTTATVNVATPGSYRFYVTASNSWGESLQSNTVSTPPTATGPKNITIKITPKP